MTIFISSRILTKIHLEFNPKSSWTHLKAVCCCHYSFGFLQIAVCQLRHVLITIFGFVSQKIAMSSNVPKNFYCQELTYPWWSEIWWVSVLYESSNLIWDSLLKCLDSLFFFIWSSSSSTVCRVPIFGLQIGTSGLGQNFNLNFLRKLEKT